MKFCKKYAFFLSIIWVIVISYLILYFRLEDRSILLLGFDKRSGVSSTLPDVIQAILVNHHKKEIIVISIPRDLYVETDGYAGRINKVEGLVGSDKIHSSDYSLLRKAVSNILAKEINDFIAVDMSGVQTIVDTLGGVTVNVKCALSENFLLDDGSFKNYTFKSGPVFMSGEDALAYARARRIGGDFSRISHQHQVIQGLKHKFMEVGLFTKLRALVRIKNNIYTNVLLIEQIRLALILYDLENYSVKGIGFRNEFAVDHVVVESGQRVITLDKNYFRLAIENSTNLSELGTYEQPCAPGWFQSGKPIIREEN